MKHVMLVSKLPAVAQYEKQSSKEAKGLFLSDLAARLEQTARSMPWGVKFPTSTS